METAWTTQGRFRLGHARLDRFATDWVGNEAASLRTSGEAGAAEGLPGTDAMKPLSEKEQLEERIRRLRKALEQVRDSVPAHGDDPACF